MRRKRNHSRQLPHADAMERRVGVGGLGNRWLRLGWVDYGELETDG